MKGLSILALVIVAFACVMAQEESNDSAMLVEADESAFAARDSGSRCSNCHPYCPPGCHKPPHHHYNHHHHPHHCPQCPTKPTCPTCPPQPTCPPPITCPPPHCPTCPSCPTQPPCQTCPTQPTCPPCPTLKPCLHPDPIHIGVCLDVDIGK